MEDDFRKLGCNKGWMWRKLNMAEAGCGGDSGMNYESCEFLDRNSW